MTLVMGTIFFLSHQSGDSIELSLFAGMDKVSHLIAYFVLALSVYFAHTPQLHFHSRVRVVLQVTCFCALFALSDEYHQSFIPGRMVSIGDLVADLLGVILATFLYLYFHRRILSYLVEREKH